MAFTTARRALLRLSAATTARHRSFHAAIDETVAKALEIDYPHPHRRWSVAGVDDTTACVRLRTSGLLSTETKVWLEDKAVVVECEESAPDPTMPRRDCGGVVVLPPGNAYALDRREAFFRYGCIYLLLGKEKGVEAAEGSGEMIEIKVK